MSELYADIEIDASAKKVWDILMDFNRYPEWNPFIKKIRGSSEIGSKLEVVMQPEGRKPTTFKPKVLANQPYEEFRWLGKLLIQGIFDGEHIFLIESLDENRVKFVQQEYFKGILANSIMKSIGDVTQRAFEAMNQALKQRAEKLV
jgi:hypothetical protein